MSRTEIAGLLERVREAKGPDSHLDQKLFAAFWGWGCPLHGAALYDFGQLGDGGQFTSSIDAADALIERELPGWSRESGRSGFGNPAWCRMWNPLRSPGQGNDIRADHDSGSEPLARIAALLTALTGGDDGK